MPNLDLMASGPGFDRLRALFREHGHEAVRINCFSGTNPNATPDMMAAEVVKATEQIMRGEAQLVYNIDKRSNTRVPQRAGSAGTERHDEAGHPAASPRQAETL